MRWRCISCITISYPSVRRCYSSSSVTGNYSHGVPLRCRCVLRSEGHRNPCSYEKRLARALRLLANFGKEGEQHPVIAKVSQETLADMIGTTRSATS
jgi:hypothetical protein